MRRERGRGPEEGLGMLAAELTRNGSSESGELDWICLGFLYGPPVIVVGR